MKIRDDGSLRTLRKLLASDNIPDKGYDVVKDEACDCDLFNIGGMSQFFHFLDRNKYTSEFAAMVKSPNSVIHYLIWVVMEDRHVKLPYEARLHDLASIIFSFSL